MWEPFSSSCSNSLSSSLTSRHSLLFLWILCICTFAKSFSQLIWPLIQLLIWNKVNSVFDHFRYRSSRNPPLKGPVAESYAGATLDFKLLAFFFLPGWFKGGNDCLQAKILTDSVSNINRSLFQDVLTLYHPSAIESSLPTDGAVARNKPDG